MKTRAILAAAAVVGLLAACNNKEGERTDANTSSGATTAAPVRLAQLDAAPFMNEVWIMNEGGAQVPFIYYQADNVRVSAQCRSATGQLACDALKFLRSSPPVQMKRAQLDGRTSAGVKVCKQMNQPIVTAHNASGNEDSFCKFPDGSLLATGSLEQYGMQVGD
jgi:hypothetical protein